MAARDAAARYFAEAGTNIPAHVDKCRCTQMRRGATLL